ncbi:MAG: glycosyltransferase family 4 protein [Pseudorhodobacter sp.]|nr:glycosyltransferase family 4 protein [Frankiaceae bacterium]
MRVALLMWPNSFEDWYEPLGLDRQRYLDEHDGEWVLTLTRALRLAGADVTVVHGTVHTAGTGVQRSSGVRTDFVPVSPAYRAFRTWVWGGWRPQRERWWPVAPALATLSPRLVGHLVRLRPDVVVVQDYESVRYDVAAPLLRAVGLHVVGLDTGGSAAPSSAPWKKVTARLSRRLLAVNEAEAARVRRHGHRDVAVWPVPVDTDAYAPADRAAARSRLGIAPTAKIVLSVGRLHPVKGLPELADAVEPLDAQLVLIGSGSEQRSLAERRQPNLRLTGRLPTEVVADWYAACDVVALASHQEGQPVAVLEALACARGVVATAVGGVPEVVIDGETGWLVPPRDPVQLRAAVTQALADPVEADRRGRAGHDRTVARHSALAAGRELLRLLR